jgi:hypothetical protein
MEQTERKALGDVFDRTIRSMNGLPDLLPTKATTVRSLSSVLELSQTFIVQTYRQKDEGDTIFIEYIGAEGSLRLALPAAVSEVIARQGDSLTDKSRSKAAKANALDRKARGNEPGFKIRHYFTSFSNPAGDVISIG